jgi:hypothetical protein
MRLAWFLGGLVLLVSSTGCCCGSCGGWGRGYPAATYQAATPQYGTAGSYASSPTGSPLSGTATADGSMSSPAAASGIATSPSSAGSPVQAASHQSTTLE